MSDNPRIAELRARVEADPTSIAFAQLAEEYRRAGNYEAAEQCCRAGLVHHPGYVSARVTLGRTLVALSQLDEAEEELELVLQGASENLAALRAMAELHEKRGDLRRALDAHRRAAAFANNDPTIEAAIDRLSRDLGTTAPPASMERRSDSEKSAAGAAPLSTDFDRLLESLGSPNRPAPPMIEALLTKSELIVPDTHQVVERQVISELERWLDALRAQP